MLLAPILHMNSDAAVTSFPKESILQPCTCLGFYCDNGETFAKGKFMAVEGPPGDFQTFICATVTGSLKEYAFTFQMRKLHP